MNQQDQHQRPAVAWIVTHLAVTLGLGGGFALVVREDILDLILDRYLLLACFVLMVVSLALADYVDQRLHEKTESEEQ